jgi:hypothetical protein
VNPVSAAAPGLAASAGKPVDDVADGVAAGNGWVGAAPAGDEEPVGDAEEHATSADSTRATAPAAPRRRLTNRALTLFPVGGYRGWRTPAAPT